MIAETEQGKVGGLELSLTRRFDAPRELVFAAWTEPGHLQYWQGAPRGFEVTFHETEVQPGGAYRLCMRSSEGAELWLEGVYREIVKPEKFVFTHRWLNAGEPGVETLVSITFAAQEKQTLLTLHQSGFNSAASRDGHAHGWSSAMDKLEEYLTSVAKEQGA